MRVEKPGGGVDHDALRRAMAFPTRWMIMGKLIRRRGRPLSPNEMADELGLIRGHVFHHMEYLARLGAIAMVPDDDGSLLPGDRPYRLSGFWFRDRQARLALTHALNKPPPPFRKTTWMIVRGR